MGPIEVIPSAKRIIKSLRDLGYDFSQAVADIIDNSIEADATVVEVKVEFDGDDSWVRISDNGNGMKPDQLQEAMRYGSERDYDSDDLGKFGLGLKTASMSQCQRLSVASRTSNRKDMVAYSWDLDHIEKTNRWEILPVGPGALWRTLLHPIKDRSGTVVLWQRLDRVLGFKHPYGEAARKRLSQMCRDLEVHLAMVFHRFLSGELPGKKLRILLNGHEIKPWDPFCKREPKTRKLPPIRLKVEHEGRAGKVVVVPFILPNQESFSTPDAFRHASGPANWNQQQGFYIYRAGRMIQSGGWSNLHAPDEHMKLARIALSFSPELDEAFKINVAKMRVQLPAQIRDAVKDAIAPVRKLAREVYDRKDSAEARAAAEARPHVSQSSRSVVPSRPAGHGEITLTFRQWARRLLEKTRTNELQIVRAVLGRLKADSAA
jgi:hypothetical protein